MLEFSPVTRLLLRAEIGPGSALLGIGLTDMHQLTVQVWCFSWNERKWLSKKVAKSSIIRPRTIAGDCPRLWC